MTPERVKDEVYSILRRLNLLENPRYLTETVTESFTIDPSSRQEIYFVDSSSGNVLIVLPEASLVTGKSYTFKKIVSANTVYLQPVESQTIDGQLTYSFNDQYDCVTIVSDGSNYYIINGYSGLVINSSSDINDLLLIGA